MNSKTSRSKTFNSRLAAYSATATAALLAAPMAADATIQNLTTFSFYNGPFGTVPPSASGFSSVKFSAATADHIAGLKGGVLRAQSRPATDNYNLYLKIGGSLIAKPSGVGFLGNNKFASNLELGASIAGKNFLGGAINLANKVHTSTTYASGFHTTGNFLPNGANAKATGYIGFKTDLRGNTYYGWLRVQVSNNAEGKPFEVSLVAKDGDPGIYGAFGLASDDIKTGEVAPVPEPSAAAIGGLGLLALGATGVREMRRRKAEIKN